MKGISIGEDSVVIVCMELYTVDPHSLGPALVQIGEIFGLVK